MKTITINVTKEILEKSSNCSQGFGDESLTKTCAVALAVRKSYPKATVGFVNVWLNDLNQKATLPSDVQQFINKFDRATPEQRRAMEPFSFQLNVPE